MRFYQAWHVLCPRIANLYSASAENCVKFIRYWKVLIYQIQKSFSYVRGNIFVKSWIEPDNVRGAISFLFYVLFICINLTFLWLSLRAFSYSPFDMSKTCLFEELFDKWSASPSSLYKPEDCLSSLFDNKDSI